MCFLHVYSNYWYTESEYVDAVMKPWLKYEVHIRRAFEKHNDKLLWWKELQHNDMTEPGWMSSDQKNKIF